MPNRWGPAADLAVLTPGPTQGTRVDGAAASFGKHCAWAWWCQMRCDCRSSSATCGRGDFARAWKAGLFPGPVQLPTCLLPSPATLAKPHPHGPCCPLVPPRPAPDPRCHLRHCSSASSCPTAWAGLGQVPPCPECCGWGCIGRLLPGVSEPLFHHPENAAAGTGGDKGLRTYGWRLSLGRHTPRMGAWKAEGLPATWT